MDNPKTNSFFPRLLMYIVIGFVVLMAVLWFFKEDIDLAVIPQSKASIEIQVSTTKPPVRSENLTPSQQYLQGILNDPENFDTSAFEEMLPAQAMMHSEDMFLVGF